MAPTTRIRRSGGLVLLVTALAVLAASALPSLDLAGAGTANAGASSGSAATVEGVAAAEPAGDAAASTVAPPYDVTTLSSTVVDPSRSTPARGSVAASAVRTLEMTTWYPSLDEGEQPSVSFPLVVFVHGYGVDAATYADLLAEIAAQGFVVVAPDFPLSSSAYGPDAVRDPVGQAADVRFVITTLLDPTTAPSEIAGLVDASAAVGVIGHSDGGITPAGVAFAADAADSRLGAAVVLSGAEAFFPGPWFTGTSPALLAIHGDADEVNPFAASRTLYDDDPGERWLVSVDGGSHLGPFTTDPVRSRVATLAGDFLRATLTGDTAAHARLATDAAADGLSLVASA